ncbi:MAG: hypothetical protein SVQ76_02380, partial [Candidatus Nanohaloarchaea archaeon]|nr:hypothetical protein [Candidatus Nanohaloarchaea archaeon]
LEKRSDMLLEAIEESQQTSGVSDEVRDLKEYLDEVTGEGESGLQALARIAVENQKEVEKLRQELEELNRSSPVIVE